MEYQSFEDNIYSDDIDFITNLNGLCIREFSKHLT